MAVKGWVRGGREPAHVIFTSQQWSGPRGGRHRPVSSTFQAPGMIPLGHHPATPSPKQQQLRLQLFDDPHSLYTAKVKIVLHAKQLVWEALAVPCGSTRSEEYLQLNPLGKIPALVVHDTAAAVDGAQAAPPAVIVESEVINEWLEEQFPTPPLLPPSPLARSRARFLSRFHDLYLEPALRKLYPQVSPAARVDAVVESAAAEYVARLHQLEAFLEPHAAYSVYDGLTLGDTPYPALFHYADLILPVLGQGFDYSSLPRLQRWREALSRDPNVRNVMSELEPAALAWLQGKLAAV